MVDDRSTDGTREVAIEAAQGNPNLRIVEGTEPPTDGRANHGPVFEPAKKPEGHFIVH